MLLEATHNTPVNFPHASLRRCVLVCSVSIFSTIYPIFITQFYHLPHIHPQFYHLPHIHPQFYHLPHIHPQFYHLPHIHPQFYHLPHIHPQFYHLPHIHPQFYHATPYSPPVLPSTPCLLCAHIAGTVNPKLTVSLSSSGDSPSSLILDHHPPLPVEIMSEIKIEKIGPSFQNLLNSCIQANVKSKVEV